MKLMFENIIMAGPMAYHINYQVDLFQVTKQLCNENVTITQCFENAIPVLLDKL